MEGNHNNGMEDELRMTVVVSEIRVAEDQSSNQDQLPVWDPSNSSIQRFRMMDGTDPNVWETSMLKDAKYCYSNTYQGVHPDLRNDPQPHLIYPIASSCR